MGTRFNPVPCKDGQSRVFVRVEYPVTRAKVAALLTYWHARRPLTPPGELTVTQVREIVRRHFEDYGTGNNGEDDWTTPTDAGVAWAERHTVKVWPDPPGSKRCPHGCGLLDWCVDQWHCPACGDEFAPDPDEENP
jgi:hypothetical protein